MKRLTTPASQQQRSTPPDALPRSGPKLIHPADFKFIAGGGALPRHGWQATSTQDSTTTLVYLPRHGW